MTRPAGAGRGAGPGEGAASRGLDIGRSDLTVAAWVRFPGGGSTGGDVAAGFDAAARRGFLLAVHGSSPCGNHPNDAEICFSIDAATEPIWTDLGSPATAAMMVCGLASFEDQLYAATWEGAPSDRGHVYRHTPDGWADVGAPGGSNAVSRLAVLDGALYAGTSRLKGGGSAMPDSANVVPGGRIYRYEGGTTWADLGELPGADSVAGLVPFDGALYAIPMYSEGLFRLAGGGRWEWCGSPGRRLLALGVHRGALYGAGNDHADVESAIAATATGVVVPARSSHGGGGVFRYEGGDGWTALGLQPDTTQVYSIETYGDEIHIGTWPTGLVFRSASGGWRSIGRLGDETEVMNLLAFGGALYAGTLPGASVFRYDGADRWTRLAILDATPDVRYRRAAAMAVHRGELVVGTLPSAHVWSMRAGQAVSSGRTPAPGWHHVAATRSGPVLELHVDGRPVASWSDPAGSVLDLGETPAPTFARGPRGGFDGDVAQASVEARCWSREEIAAAAADPPRER